MNQSETVASGTELTDPDRYYQIARYQLRRAAVGVRRLETRVTHSPRNTVIPAPPSDEQSKT
ncbi:hypothetical protein [Rhodococcus sp. IEGM 1379]|uniref:hypothetical protein n=1 Tax=Rhodococcus sp. IEGM 1379 TaxID=3047086 RepID=UPI0024B6C6ED|nr:hypothetical protein [Rhodococcus sp. IEGM 1379]MDI9916843.1 hypothetical protein [Rhodococcus sp. IEGM 1379]